MEDNKVEIEINDLDDRTIALIYELADERGVSIDELVEEMLKEYLENEGS